MLRKEKATRRDYHRLLMAPCSPATPHSRTWASDMAMALLYLLLLSILLLLVDLLHVLDNLKHERASDAWNLSLGGLECRFESF